MRQSTLLRFLLITLGFACVLGGTSFLGFRYFNELSTHEVRRHMVLFIAQTVESAPYLDSVEDYHFKSNGRSQGSSLWVISENGQLLAKNTPNSPPISLDEVKKPEAAHDFTYHYRFLHLIPDLVVVKLEAKNSSKSDTYLFIESRRVSSGLEAVWVQATFFFFVIGISILTALGVTYFYLSRKSAEARAVLSRLEKGDLKARFQIKRIDEIGSLMLDFNRMASEIERLVLRIQETESARKNLLEELGHDIRTPLTSLRTTVETLYEHHSEMAPSAQAEFIGIVRTELRYFLHLIEDLFFIANLGEPKYKKSTEKVDIKSLVEAEVRSRKALRESASAPTLSWHLATKGGGSSDVPGDSILIQRLIKNAFDNAVRHARTSVRVLLENTDHFVLIRVEDDGPGISDEAIASFGNRKKTRFFTLEAPGPGQSLSLGLGSVIMKTILELHGGEVQIAKMESGGTRLTLTIPK